MVVQNNTHFPGVHVSFTGKNNNILSNTEYQPIEYLKIIMSLICLFIYLFNIWVSFSNLINYIVLNVFVGIANYNGTAIKPYHIYIIVSQSQKQEQNNKSKAIVR